MNLQWRGSRRSRSAFSCISRQVRNGPRNVLRLRDRQDILHSVEIHVAWNAYGCEHERSFFAI
jgi:hypothetical protein